MGQEDICGGVKPAVLDVSTRHVRGGGVQVYDGVLVGEFGVGVGFVGQCYIQRGAKRTVGIWCEGGVFVEDEVSGAQDDTITRREGDVDMLRDGW